jgi:hypothetical protein
MEANEIGMAYEVDVVTSRSRSRARDLDRRYVSGRRSTTVIVVTDGRGQVELG